MSNNIGDDIDADGIVVPDRPQTALAFRTWRVSDSGALLSINAPSLTGKAGGSGQVKRISWIHRHLADSEGQDGWPVGQALKAHCGQGGDRMVDGMPVNPDHGPIPSKHCSCGIYATTSINVINQYLGNEIIMGTIAIRGPVLGVVELGGHVVPATQGFRAAYARVAGIIAVDPAFSLTHPQLKLIAERYRVPLLDDMSLDPEDYREAIAGLPAIIDPSKVGDEADAWLQQLTDEDGGEQ